MPYSIKEFSEKVNLTAYTLRYYEKEGLLPFVERDKQGNRMFGDEDLEWISLICCLRDTGMPIADIKHYVDLCIEGNETVETRRQIILNQKHFIEQKMQALNQHLDKINKKLAYYDDLTSKNVEACTPRVGRKNQT